MHAATGLAVAIVLSCGLGGCATPNRSDTPPSTPPQAGDAIWPYWPVRVRLHPLTRLVREEPDGTEIVLETRIEFFDRFGHTAKGVGIVTLELFDQSDRPGARPLAVWKRDLTKDEINRLHFDDVTRTYLLRLDLEVGQLPASPVLVVTVSTADGDELADRLAVRTK